jgi:hypothetical protein
MHRTQRFATVGLILIAVAGGLAACQPETEDPSAAPPAGESTTAVATQDMPTQASAQPAPAGETTTAPGSAAGGTEAADHQATDEHADADTHEHADEHAEGAPPAIDAEPDVVVEVDAATAGGMISTIGRHELALGDVVLLRITSDVADHVHVHGYDYSIPVSPGVPAEMKFRADIAGIFEVELEESKLKLFDLLVR